MGECSVAAVWPVPRVLSLESLIRLVGLIRPYPVRGAEYPGFRGSFRASGDPGYSGAPYLHSARIGTGLPGRAGRRACASLKFQQALQPLAHQKILEDRCLTEVWAPYSAPFLPPGTKFPPKSGLQPDCRLDSQATAAFTVDFVRTDGGTLRSPAVDE